MLKKMQRRFILAAMAAFGTVMLVLVVGINIANYHRTTSMQDDLAVSLLEYEQNAHAQRERAHREHKREPREPQRLERESPPFDRMPAGGRGPEAPFMTRFFAVYCDVNGNFEMISKDYIYSIDEETAKAYAQVILSKGKEKGYYGDYRYHASTNETGSTVLFLNVSQQLQFMKNLFLISAAIGFFSILVVFLLVVFFSRYAIRPYEKNMERQKRFITDAGHELKTPITSIAASADIAAMEHEGDAWISNIQKQTARLTRLVGELVTLSRLDEELPFPEKGTFSLSDAAWETAEPFAVLAKAEGKSYHQSIEEKLTLYGDCASIQQMLSILLDNAVKYSDADGEIRLDIYRKRRKVCIEVFNTCDLPDEVDLDRLFDRFYRVDESRCACTGGTGIGLSMAQAVAEAHGGKIKAQRAGKKAIRFRVTL